MNDYYKTCAIPKPQNKLKMYFQKKYELKLRSEGVSPERARESFINLIGRSYI